jgi:hypothetical protein
MTRIKSVSQSGKGNQLRFIFAFEDNCNDYLQKFFDEHDMTKMNISEKAANTLTRGASMAWKWGCFYAVLADTLLMTFVSPTKPVMKMTQEEHQEYELSLDIFHRVYAQLHAKFLKQSDLES